MTHFNVCEDYLKLPTNLLSSFRNIDTVLGGAVSEQEKNDVTNILIKTQFIEKNTNSENHRIRKERDAFKTWNAEDMVIEASHRDLNYHIQQLFKNNQRNLFITLKDLNNAFSYRNHPTFIILSATSGTEFIMHPPFVIDNNNNSKRLYQYELKSNNRILAFEYCKNSASDKVLYKLNHIIPNTIPFFSPIFTIHKNDKTIHYNAITHNIHNEVSGYNLDVNDNYNLFYGLHNHSNRAMVHASPLFPSINEHGGYKRKRKESDIDFEPYVGKPKFKMRRNGSHYALRSQTRLSNQ